MAKKEEKQENGLKEGKTRKQLKKGETRKLVKSGKNNFSKRKSADIYRKLLQSKKGEIRKSKGLCEIEIAEI